jgi:lipopolysaccharide export system permease protein
LIVQRYLIREILHSFFAVFSILLVISATVIFVRMLAEMSASVFSSGFILQIMALNILGKLSMLLPAALYVSILLALSRLYSDSEIVAMWAGGVGPRRINSSIFRFLIVFAVVTAIVSLYLSPEAWAMRDVIWTRAKAEAEVSGVLPGRFLEFRDGELVAYTESLSADKREMENVFAKLTVDRTSCSRTGTVTRERPGASTTRSIASRSTASESIRSVPTRSKASRTPSGPWI